MTTKEIKEIIGNTISEMQESVFSSYEQLKVIYPVYMESYVPKHPAGEFLVTYRSSSFGNSKNTGSVVQDKDVSVSVFTVVKFAGQGKAPEDYTDFLEAALTGIKLNVNRRDKFIYPSTVQYIKQQNGYWWYESRFICPAVNIQQNHL